MFFWFIYLSCKVYTSDKVDFGQLLDFCLKPASELLQFMLQVNRIN